MTIILYFLIGIAIFIAMIVSNKLEGENKIVAPPEVIFLWPLFLLVFAAFAVILVPAYICDVSAKKIISLFKKA